MNPPPCTYNSALPATAPSGTIHSPFIPPMHTVSVRTPAGIFILAVALSTSALNFSTEKLPSTTSGFSFSCIKCLFRINQIMILLRMLCMEFPL